MNEKTVYDPLVAMDKATGDGAAVGAAGGTGVVLGGVLVSALRAHGLAPWPLGADGAVVGLVATGLAAGAAALKRFLRNRRKHKLDLVVLAMVCLAAAGSGCRTMTAPDGTVVRELDVRGIDETWHRLGLKWKEPPPEGAPRLVLEGPPVEVTIEAED